MPASSRVIITGIWRPPKPTTESMAKFESWASSSRPPTFTLKSDEIRAGLALPEREAEAFKQKIREAVRDSNAVVAIEVIDEISELLSEVKCEFQSLTYAGRSAMTLRGICAQQLYLGQGDVRLENTRVGMLRIRSEICLSNVWVSTMNLEENIPVQRLIWRKGYLGNISINRYNRRSNPFSGDISFTAVQFSQLKDRHGVQWLRDTRVMLLEKNNVVAAGVFHAAELRLAEQDATIPARLVSVFYRLGSNYGNSIGTPVIYLLLFWALAALTGIIFGTSAHVGVSAGWQTALTQDGWDGEALRAVVYAVQVVFNPLNLLGSRPLVSPNHWGGALLGSLFGILGIVSIALFFVSVRRRFKLE